jgi:ABC-type glycerol-3-phosphate transport system permease component
LRGENFARECGNGPIRQLGNTGIIVGSLLAIAPMILAFVFLQRYWQSGLGTGGMKA